MAIHGIGTDITAIRRVREILNGRTGKRFVRRILTEGELNIAGRREARMAEFASGRFAAKEAVSKALGCGIGEAVGFQDIEILPDAWGKPVCTISKEALMRLSLPDETVIHLSISHNEDSAIAYALAEVGKD